MSRIIFLNLLMISFAAEQCLAAPFLSLSLAPSSDTILAGTSLTIVATVKDTLGTEYPSYEASIHWSLSDILHDGKLLATGKSATLIAIKAYQTDTVKAMLFIPPMSNYFANSLITILPNRAYQVHIEKDSTPASFWNIDSPDTVYVIDYSSVLHFYAQERDTFENYIGIAKNPSWVTLKSGIISISSPSSEKGRVDVSAIDSGICPLVVADSTLIADTVYIFITSRPQVNTLFSSVIKKGGNNIREIYNLKGMKLNGHTDVIYGVYIEKKGNLFHRRVRIAGSLTK